METHYCEPVPSIKLVGKQNMFKSNQIIVLNITYIYIMIIIMMIKDLQWLNVS